MKLNCLIFTILDTFLNNLVVKNTATLLQWLLLPYSFKWLTVPTPAPLKKQCPQNALQRKGRASRERQKSAQQCVGGLQAYRPVRAEERRKAEDEDGMGAYAVCKRSFSTMSGCAGLVKAHGFTQPSSKIHLLNLGPLDERVALQMKITWSITPWKGSGAKHFIFNISCHSITVFSNAFFRKTSQYWCYEYQQAIW